MKNAAQKITALLILSLITVAGFSQYNNAFRFRINGNGYSDETIIRLMNGATESFDGAYDAWKLFSPNPNVPSIYSQVTVGQELSINTLPEFNEDVSIILYTNIPVTGTYTLDIEEVYALSSNYKVSISDISSNTDFIVLGDTALSFEYNAQQNSPTFTFNISSDALVSSVDESCASNKNGALNVDNKGNNDWTIEIIDDNSNVIITENVTSPVYNFNNLGAGNYTAVVSSKGIVDNYSFTINPGEVVVADFEMNADTLYIDEGAELFLTNNSQNSQSFLWNFGDGNTSSQANPIHNFNQVGTFNVRLASINGNCFAEQAKQVVVYLTQSLIGTGLATSINEESDLNSNLLSLGNGSYQINSNSNEKKSVQVVDLKGGVVYEDVFSGMNYNFSLVNNPSGIYVANVVSEAGQIMQSKIVR